MIGFRFKLGVGFGAMVAVLVATGVLAQGLLADYGGLLDRVFRENFASVGYGERMKEANEAIDRAVRARIAGDASGRGAAEHARVLFAENLRRAKANITVEGEAEVVGRLDSLWKARQSRLDNLFAVPEPAAVATFADSLDRDSREVAAATQALVDLNLGNIVSVDGQVKQGAQRARRTLTLLLAGGVALGILLALVFSAWVARPLKNLTKSVKEIGKGNLDLVVPVASRDELGELAEAFNGMATQLRVFRRSDRQRLWRVHRTTQNAIDSLPDAVVVVSPEGKVEMANGTARRIFGLDPDANLDERCEGRLVAYFREALATREPVQPQGFEAALQAFDRGERFYLPRAIPILESDRSVAGVTLVLADITLLRRLDEMKSGALSVVAHELRTPLTSLRMASRLLLDERVGILEPRQEELAAGLAEDADRLWRIVEELLDIGRMDAGRSLPERTEQDPAPMLRQAVAEREGGFREKGVKLSLETPASGAKVGIDAARMSLAVGNLLSNALRHTPAGGEVKVAVRREGGEVVLAVSDTGEGIAPEHQARLFERFYRVPGQPGSTGVGLGLSIVREIVQAHDGRIAVSSRPGQGSRFEIRLPAKER